MAKKTSRAKKQKPSTKLPKAPKPYREFIKRYPALAGVWESITEAGKDGPLDPRTARLVHRLYVATGVHERDLGFGGAPRLDD